VRCQRYMFRHLPQKLAFPAAEGMCFPPSRNKDSEDFALDQVDLRFQDEKLSYLRFSFSSSVQAPLVQPQELTAVAKFEI
jgi:hypothetical protein